MNDPSPLMMSRSYGMWPPPVPAVDDPSNPFPNPNRPPFTPAAAAPAAAVPPNYARPHWMPSNKGKKPPPGHDPAAGAVAGPYLPPDHPEPPPQYHPNRYGRAPRRFYKKKHNNNAYGQGHGHHPLAARAPRNTTSYLIRAKRAGGIASLVSPCPVTPAVLPTPKFSPSREALVDTAKEEWGVDGYGSMNGLIRLRSPRDPAAGMPDPDDEGAEEESSESDVEEHVEVERRLDHDLSRFEMVYCPSFADLEGRRGGGGGGGPSRARGHPHHHDPSYLLGSPLDERDTHILRLEEENLTLRDRLFLMERDMADMRRRLVMVEMECRGRNAGDGNSHNNNNHIGDNCNTSAIVEEASDTEEAEGVCSEKSVGD